MTARHLAALDRGLPWAAAVAVVILIVRGIA